MTLIIRSLILFSLCCVNCTSIFSQQQQDWPRWSGPNGDFRSPELDWSTEWSGELKQLWQAKLGTGFSSVSVVDGLLYTMGREADDDVVYCLDAETGTEKWQFKYAAPLFANLHEGGPGATPTVDGQFVYTISRDGKLYCFDRLNGKVQWTENVCEIVGVDAPEWGITSSPLVVGEKLLLEAGRIVALNKSTGKEIWQTKTKNRPGYGTPVVFEHDSQQLVVSLNNDNVLVAKLDDGEEVASYPWKTSYATSSSTPIVNDDTIFISTGYKQGCILLKLENGELSKVYENKKMANHMNNCVLIDGFLYGIHGNAHNARTCTLVCMDYESGEVKWSHRGWGCGSLMAAGKRLLILSDTGTLVCATATSEAYDELDIAEVLDGKCWTVPVLLDGKIYCRNAKGSLVCVQLPR